MIDLNHKPQITTEQMELKLRSPGCSLGFTRFPLKLGLPHFPFLVRLYTLLSPSAVNRRTGWGGGVGAVGDKPVPQGLQSRPRIATYQPGRSRSWGSQSTISAKFASRSFHNLISSASPLCCYGTEEKSKASLQKAERAFAFLPFFYLHIFYFCLCFFKKKIRLNRINKAKLFEYQRSLENYIASPILSLIISTTIF